MEQTLGAVTQRCTQVQFKVHSEPWTSIYKLIYRSPCLSRRTAVFNSDHPLSTNCYQFIDPGRMHDLIWQVSREHDHLDRSQTSIAMKRFMEGSWKTPIPIGSKAFMNPVLCSCRRCRSHVKSRLALG